MEIEMQKLRTNVEESVKRIEELCTESMTNDPNDPNDKLEIVQIGEVRVVFRGNTVEHDKFGIEARVLPTASQLLHDDITSIAPYWDELMYMVDNSYSRLQSKIIETSIKMYGEGKVFISYYNFDVTDITYIST